MRAIMQDLCITATRDHNVYASFRPSIVTKDVETCGKMNSECGCVIEPSLSPLPFDEQGLLSLCYFLFFKVKYLF